MFDHEYHNALDYVIDCIVHQHGWERIEAEAWITLRAYEAGEDERAYVLRKAAELEKACILGGAA
jgi:hypothetical protein